MITARKYLAAFGIGLLLSGLGACNSIEPTPSPSGETVNSSNIDWPTATPPEGWVVEPHEVVEGSTDHDRTVIAIYREGKGMGTGQFNHEGGASVIVEVMTHMRPPEELVEVRLEDEGTERLEDREIDGVTFVGYTDTADLSGGGTVYFNYWWGQIPDDGVTIEIFESSGSEGKSVLDELTAISDTIDWPDDTSWAGEKWRSL